MIDEGKHSLLATAEEAADWYLIFEAEDTVSAADRRAFVRWLRRSPVNIEEFMRVGAMQKAFSDMALTELPSVKVLIQEARSNVVVINKPPSRQPLDTRAKPPVFRAAHKKRLGAIAAFLLVAAIPLFWLAEPGFDSSNFKSGGGYSIETARGEQRSILLPDGSVVTLNTQSRLEVDFSEELRRVELATGEAFFNVAKDAARPFRVDAGSAVVEVIGTQFNVYQQRAQTLITVLEGQVSVTTTEAPISQDSVRTTLPGHQINDRVVRLVPGKQLAVSSSGALAASTSVDSSHAIAWTNRRLVFDHNSLHTVVRELNRYNSKQLTIGDPQVARRAISGVFSANEPAALVAFLSEIGGLHIETDAAGKGWTLYAEPASLPNSPQQP